MKEWLIVTRDDDPAWHDLADEALAFVRSKSRPQ